MTDAMTRLSNLIFRELDVFHSFHHIKRQTNENVFLTHADGHASALQCLGDHVTPCDSQTTHKQSGVCPA